MKVVILGGGPSGLGAALGLAEAGHRDIVLIEKNAGLGGLSSSYQWEGATLDYGPHRLSPEFPDIIEKFQKLLGTDLLKVPNDHAVHFRGRTYRYPPIVKDFLNIPSVRLSAQTLGSLMWSRVRFRKPTTFAQTISHSFGKKMYEDVVAPLCEKVWGDPSLLDPDFAKVRFSVPTMEQWAKKWLGGKEAQRDDCFFYPRQGFQQLWSTLGAHLESLGVKILKETQISEIKTSADKVVAVVTKNQTGAQQWECDWLISTIPLETLGALIHQPVATDLENRGMLLANFKISRERILPARVVIFPERDYLFNRLSEPKLFSDDVVEKGSSVLQVDVVLDTKSSQWCESDNAWLDRLQAQVLSLGLFSRDEILARQLVRVRVAYPQPTSRRERAQEEWNANLPFKNLLCSGRFASSDYNNSHTALKKGLMLAEMLPNNPTPKAWYQRAEEVRKSPIRD